MKSLCNPPRGVASTLSLVCALLGSKVTSWRSSQKAMASPTTFLANLLEYDAWHIDQATARKAKKLARDLNTSEQEMSKKSKPAGKIYAWAEAVMAIAGFSPEQAREFPVAQQEEAKKLLV